MHDISYTSSLRSRLIGLENDPEIDALTRLATAVTGKPFALVSILDGPIRWSKAQFGINVGPAPRELSFCCYCVEAGQPLIIDDASTHPQFSLLPAVKEKAGIRFYAGIPIHVSVGNLQIDATLCVLDVTPGSLSSVALENLVSLAELLGSLMQAKLTAATDHLTGLWNQRAFDKTLLAAFNSNGGNPSMIHLCLLDIDRFKGINDTHGHDAGDRVIQSVAEKLKSACLPDSMIGRIGGDEFAILVTSDSPHAGHGSFRDLPARLRHTLDGCLDISITAGYASLEPSFGSPGHLMKAADVALYEAKRRERGSSFCFQDMAA